MTIEIQPLTSDELTYSKSLMKKHTNELGFLPTAALEWYADNGHAWHAVQNDEPAGYCIAKPLSLAPSVYAIIQACIQFDARRRAGGLSLVDHVVKTAERDGRKIVQCWCAADIEAVEFWRAAGFSEIMRRDGGKSRGRQLILFRRLTKHGKAEDTSRDIVIRGPGGAFVRASDRPKHVQLDLFDTSADPMNPMLKGY